MKLKPAQFPVAAGTTFYCPKGDPLVRTKRDLPPAARCDPRQDFEVLAPGTIGAQRCPVCKHKLKGYLVAV